jgi:hypothetical protein
LTCLRKIIIGKNIHFHQEQMSNNDFSKLIVNDWASDNRVCWADLQLRNLQEFKTNLQKFPRLIHAHV